MTKIELQQANSKLAAENDALRSELSKLKVQLVANSDSTTLGDIKAAMAAAKAKALATGKCTAVRY
jgi:hypothetical protein